MGYVAATVQLNNKGKRVMEVTSVSFVTSGALSKVSPKDAQPQHHVQSSSSYFVGEIVHTKVFKSGQEVESYVDGSSCSGSPSGLGRTLVLRGGPITDGNLLGLGGIEKKKK